MQAQAPVSPAYDLGHYLRPIARHRVLLIVCLVLGLALGVAYGVVKSPTYTSATSVNVYAAPVVGASSSVNTVNGRTAGSVNPDTEAQIIKSTELALAVQRTLAGLNPPIAVSVPALRSRVSVTVPANSTVFRITCAAHQATVAFRCAQAYGADYLANRQTIEQNQIDAQQKATQKQLNAAQGQILSLNRRASLLAKGSPQRNSLFAAVASETTNINALNAANNQLKTTIVNPGATISNATPGERSSTSRLIPPISGLIVGLIVGLIAVYLRERLDKKVRNSDDMARDGLGLLAELPQAKGRNTSNRRRSEYVARTRFDQRIASVITTAFDTGGGVIYVAPVSADQVPDGVAQRLVTTLGAIGRPAELFVPGTDPALLPDALASTNLDVRYGDAATSATPGSLGQRLENAKQRSQFVIIEAEPAVTDLHAYLLAELSDASLLVIDPEATLRDDLSEVVDQVAVTPSVLLGGVIWRADKRGRDRNSTTMIFDGSEPRGGKRRGTPAVSQSVDAGR